MSDGGAGGIQPLDTLWLTGLTAVIVYCVCQTIRDFRAKRYGWSLAAALSALLLSTMPVVTQTISIDLPAP